MTELTKAQMMVRKRIEVPYSRAIGEMLCDLIVDGLTPQEACDGRDGRPSHFSTLYLWLRTEPEFKTMYDTCWIWRVDHMAREIVAIADDSEGDYKLVPNPDEKSGGDGIAVFQRENVARSKHRTDMRWRILATLLPKQYGGALLGGAAPRAGDDAKLIEATAEKDEVTSFTAEQLREEALAWDAKK